MSDTKLWVDLRYKMQKVVHAQYKPHIEYYKTIRSLYTYISKNHSELLRSQSEMPVDHAYFIHYVFYQKTYEFVSEIKKQLMKKTEKRKYMGWVIQSLVKVRKQYIQSYLEYYYLLPGWLPLVLRSQIVSYAYPIDLSLI